MNHHIQVGYDRLEAALDALVNDLKLPKPVVMAVAYGYLCELTGDQAEADRVWDSFPSLVDVEVNLKLAK